MSSGTEVIVAKPDGTKSKTLIKEDNIYSAIKDQSQQNCKIKFSYNETDNSLLCFMVILNSDSSTNRSSDMFSGGQIPYYCSVSFMWKTYKLDM